MLNLRKILLFFIIIVLFSSMNIANAFDVDLKQWTFYSTEKRNMPMYVANISDKPLALQIKIYTREFNVEGEEFLTGIYPDIEVLPSNVLVNANSKSLVTLLWTGKMPKEEVPLRIVVTQLPIDFGYNDSSSLKMMFESVKTLYIKPPNSKPDMKLISYEWDSKEQMLYVLVENKGTASLFSDYWEIKLDDKLINVYPYDDVKDIVFGKTSQANFLAGEIRRIPIQIVSDKPLLSVNKVELVEIHKE